MSNPLPYELSGNNHSDTILVFLHGWPDTTAVWNKVIPSLQKDYFILNVSYPNYSEKESNPKGLDIEELVARLKSTIDHVNNPKRKILIVGHDWGAMYAYHFDYMFPKTASGLITLDVGPKFMIFNPMIILYQFCLVLAFMIGGWIGQKITRLWMLLFFYNPSWKNRVDASWNYPYYYLFKRLLKCKLNIDKAILPGYQPSCGVAFVYGTLKPAKLYTQEWSDLMKEDPRHEMIKVSSVHWIQRDHSDFTIDLIRRRASLL